MPGSAASTPLTLPEMLQKLVRERSTGVLKVQGAEGWKILEVQAGAIHLVSGTETKRLRLGDILVARGKISRADVQRALEGQRRTGLPLGEVLAQRRLISRADIQDVVRFQIEEEIYDLFTWRGAECSFEENVSLGEQINGYPDAAKLAIDPQRILAEAANRIPTWQRIENVIYSPHMSFRLTDRGQSMLSTATRGGKRLLELVQEGYSVDFIVRKAMVGRFSIWKALADLLDAQAAAPIPDDELGQIVQSWESEGKLEQALGAYLRLVEVTSDHIKNGEYRGKARVLREQIAALAEEEHRGAAEVARAFRRNIRKPVIVAVTVLFVIAAATYVTLRVTAEPSAKDLGPYREARTKASDLEAQNRLAEAREVWDKYLARYPEGGGAELARSARERIERQYERMVEIEIERAQKLEQENRFAEAIALYDDILVRYPLTKKHTRISTLRANAETDAVEYTQKLNRQQLAGTLARGRELLEEGRYSEAMSYLQTVVDSGAAGSDLRNRARKSLRVIEEAEKKAEALVAKAQAFERKGDLDEALKVYKACYNHWAKSRSGRTAADKLTELGQKQARAERLYEKGLRQYAAGDFTDAVGNLRKAARYKGFNVAELATKKLEDLASANERSEKLLQEAARLEAQGLKDQAFGRLVELVERYPHTLAAKNVRVEVRIESVPAGARALFDGREIGTTPATIRVSPARSGTIALTKPGFTPLEERFDKLQSPVMLYHLQREELFRRKTGRQTKASPVSAGDRAVVRSGELLTLFLMMNGAPVWQTKVGSPVNPRAKPAVMEGTIYAGDEERLAALYLASGQRRAEYALPSPAVTTPVPIRLSLLAGRLFVIVGCLDGEVVSLDILTRRRHWSARVTPPIRFDPAVTQAAVVVPSPGGKIVAFDVLKGHTRWHEDVPGEVAGDLAADAEGKYVAAVTSLGELYIFSAADGGKLSRILIDGVHGGGVTLVSHEGGGTAASSGQRRGPDRAYVGGDDGGVRAIDTRGGRELWRQDVGGPVRDEPVVHAGTVYVGTGARSVVALDAETGKEQWRLNVGSPVTAAGLAEEDRLVICTDEGEVIGLEIEAELFGVP